MKIVINQCYGGFSLSPEAALEVHRRGGACKATPVTKYYGDADPAKPYGLNDQLAKWRAYRANGEGSDLFLTVFTDDESAIVVTRTDDRACPVLVAVVEEMGEKANGTCANLKVIEIPDGVEWEIDDYDGMESVDEVHRSWS